MRSSLQPFINKLIQILESYLAAWLQQQGQPPEVANQRAKRQSPLLVSLLQGFIIQSTLVAEFNAEAYLIAVDELLESSDRDNQ